MDIYINKTKKMKYGYSRAGTGVYSAPPRENQDYVYRCSIDMGVVSKTWAFVDAVIQQLMLSWPGHAYRYLIIQKAL